jgi:hypothetical protein
MTDERNSRSKLRVDGQSEMEQKRGKILNIMMTKMDEHGI